MATQRLAEIKKIRLEKVQKLREMGIDPYPSKSKKDCKNSDITTNYTHYEGKKVSLTGRIMSWREHGKIVFGHIQDESGSIQLFIKAQNLNETNPKIQTLGFKNLSLLDIGDFVESFGKITKTARGEISQEVEHIKILTKSICPLPEKWEGLKNQELVFRKRYLDLIMNPSRREMFKRKSLFWEVSRDFMKDHGFIEVETPILEHVTGGADARPFITHHNALDEDFYLRISTELYLKRLIGGGFEKIYTLGPNFRNEGIDEEHLQEYYQLEWYWAYANYQDNMKLVEEMFKFVAHKVYGKTKFKTRNHAFDLDKKWREIDYAEEIKKKLKVDIFKDSEVSMLKVLKKNKVELPGAINKARIVDNLWKIIRKNISGPAFLVNTPKFISPLAKSKPSDEKITERFQIIIAGSELGNGYSELNDPVDQLERFKDQEKARSRGDQEAQMLDTDFVEMLEYGMPPTSGYAHSERLFWFLENVTAREGVFFPQMKRNNKAKKNLTAGRQVTREQALQLIKEHTKNQNLVRHMFAVEAVMRALAKHFNENQESWGLAGLLHDADYEELKDAQDVKFLHTKKTLEWLENYNVSEEIKKAILAHAWNYIEGAPEPKTKMDWSLYTCDELTGLIVAVALVKGGKLSEVKIDSIMKKWKEKSFAAGANRDQIALCEEKLGVKLEDFVTIALKAMQNTHEDLEL